MPWLFSIAQEHNHPRAHTVFVHFSTDTSCYPGSACLGAYKHINMARIPNGNITSDHNLAQKVS